MSWGCLPADTVAIRQRRRRQQPGRSQHGFRLRPAFQKRGQPSDNSHRGQGPPATVKHSDLSDSSTGWGHAVPQPVCFPSDSYLRSCTLTKPNVAPFGFGKSRVGSAYAKARRVSRRRLSRGVWDEAGLLQGMDRSSVGNGTPVVQPPQEKQWRRGRRWGKRHA